MEGKLDIHKLESLAYNLEGNLLFDNTSKILYATDASVYREQPLAVAIPVHSNDITKLVKFASANKISLIPRGAGTSLAGQCVGNGLVVDVSQMNEILSFDKENKTIIVQPGIIRDELNRFLKPHNLFFSPITSTANRATIGGMVGNNSSGTTSIKYGVTRDKITSLKMIMHDGSLIHFGPLSKDAFLKKLQLPTIEGDIYRFFKNKLTLEIQDLITKEFPDASIHRRNTGYAVDEILNTSVFTATDKSFNLSKLIAGSEGTLGFITEIEIELDDVQPPIVSVVATHFDSVKDALISTKIAMKHEPFKCELMDKIILDCTKDNKEQIANRFFISGDPKAVLMVEFRNHSKDELESQVANYIRAIDKENLAFHHSQIHGSQTSKVWTLRSAGLGLLANIPGDKKAVACVEDTAVKVDDLPAYIDDFTALLKKYDQEAVYYAHAGAGEIHLRPILNLKDEKDKELFYKITKETAELVKKYKGSLSGEHGDGRVRAPFIPHMVGPDIYQLFVDIKHTFDPNNIFNAGKIVNAKSITENLRTEYKTPSPTKTTYNFKPEGGFLRAIEKCNGSGDCRKLPEENGVMCPSFHATRNEKDTTRARANMLREYLISGEMKVSADEVKDVLDLCLSCKACKSECPSGIDMAAMKAEFTQQQYAKNGASLRNKAFANIATIHKLFQFAPAIHNFGLTQKSISKGLKKMLGIAAERSIPKLHKSLHHWNKNRTSSESSRKLHLFIDEFTNYLDTEIGKKAVLLLEALGYEVIILKHPSSGRAEISKGFLAKAKKIADSQILFWKDKVTRDIPLVGIEPSAILGFRDEYLRLVDDSLLAEAKKISDNTFTIEEFLAKQFSEKKISRDLFSKEKKSIQLHVHCHQKALSKIMYSVECLSIPSQFHVELIPAGCCGMAGSFGYEKEHYDISMKIGEQILFPAVRKSEVDYVVAAGTSCRHQIQDGASVKSYHPVEILYHALVSVKKP
jgi:FAD/FMN-containing dehydrogenase/Fe-S oxidoreductase